MVEVPIVISSELNTIYITGALGGFSSNEFRVLLFSEELFPRDEETEISKISACRVVENEVRMSPETAKELAVWLMEQVEEYERTFGKIRTHHSKGPQP